MKKLLFIHIALCLITLLSAINLPLVSLATQELGSEPATLRASIQELSKSANILYYNDSFIIAQADPSHSTLPWQVLPETGQNETLYLIGKNSADRPELLSRLGKILLDMHTELLFSSYLDDVSLRQEIKAPFTILERTPLIFKDNPLPANILEETRTEIQQLISSVSADSILYFIQNLQDMGTRYALADNRLTVAQWIKNSFQRFGIANADLQSFQWNNTTQYNVVATIEGTLYPDVYIVVGGHHDSITNTTPFTLAPGADDNASGSVAAIEMARVMMLHNYQPKCSIRFVTFAAEEFGLWGSKYYAQNALENNQQIRLMINHDMIANNSPATTTVRLMPYDGSLEQTNYASGITDYYTSLSTVLGSLNSGSSDSHPFWQRGYPVIYFFETNFCPYYHTDNDITSNIDPDYCAEIIRASTAVAMSFAEMPAPPQNPVVSDTGTGTSLYISWDDVTDTAIDHYNVYWGTSPNTYLGPISVTGSSYTLEGLTSGVTYYFALASVDLSGTESYLVYATGTPSLIPAIPVNLSDTPGLGNVILSWNANTEMDLAGYYIYKSENPDSNGAPITANPINQNTYTDTNVEGSPELYYYYSIPAVDSTGNFSDYTPKVKSRPVTLNSGILIVDESANYTGTNPFQPTDAMVDDFYSGIMQNFDIHHADIDELSENLRLADIGVYSSILWHGTDFSEMSYPYGIRPALEKYLQMGGNLFFTGYMPSMAFAMNAGYPATFAANTFINQVLGIDGANHNISARFKTAIPAINGYPSLVVDSLKTTFNGHILRVETLSGNATASEVYTYGSDYANASPQGQLNGQPIAILNSFAAGKSFITSVPLYHVKNDSARDLVNHVFQNVFGESSDADDPNLAPVTHLKLLSSYPNPFQDSSTIRLKGYSDKGSVELAIYNLKGQKIRTLHVGQAKNNGLYLWNGQDDSGKVVSTGIYLLHAKQNGQSSSSKIIKMN